LHLSLISSGYTSLEDHRYDANVYDDYGKEEQIQDEWAHQQNLLDVSTNDFAVFLSSSSSTFLSAFHFGDI